MTKGKKRTESAKNLYELILPETKETSSLPFFAGRVPAGFPSPAEDFLERRLDLNEYLIRNEPATFLVRVSGNSMKLAGIFDGDLLIVDRSVPPENGRVIVGVVHGEFTVKRIQKKGGSLYLMPENDDFKPVRVTEEMNLQVWGVVTWAIHRV
jgi:DNA polymerase V